MHKAIVVKPTSVKPTPDIIEVSQRSGTIRNIDLTVAANNKKSKGFSEGGYTSNPTTSETCTIFREHSCIVCPGIRNKLTKLKLNNLYAKVVMSEFKKAEADYVQNGGGDEN